MKPEEQINLADSFQQKLFRKRIAAAMERADAGELGLREYQFLIEMNSVLALVDTGVPASITGKQMNYLKSIAEGE